MAPTLIQTLKPTEVGSWSAPDAPLLSLQDTAHEAGQGPEQTMEAIMAT